MLYETRSRSYSAGSSTDVYKIDARAVWFGNDRIETDITVSDDGYDNHGLSFAAVRAYPVVSPDGSVGTPLCSVNFSQNTVVGSYQYFHPPPETPIASITPITLPINPLLPLTDLVVRNGVAYVSTDSSIASDPDILVVDIKDHSHPAVISSLNTGPGISAISLANSYIFAAAASTAAQLHVIKINGPSSLYLAKKYQLPQEVASTSPPMGTAIFYANKRIYLGTERWKEQELAIIDVTNPENPAKISGYETDSKINAIYARGDVLYVGASDQNQLRTLNIQNPSSPILTNSFSPSGWQRQEVKFIDYFEDSLSFGRTSGGFNIVNDKELFSGISTSSSNPQYMLDIQGGVYGIVSDRDHIFVATRTVDQELSVFDRSLATSSAVYYSLPVLPQTMKCDGNHLYILAKTAPVIYEIGFYTD
ncbi:MAG: hypothetical protein NT077_02400 [Candidatus Taylorbacteria bacterium]|nr:hypothetical protein [Candidatus Taylorbacteria bacterium]